MDISIAKEESKFAKLRVKKKELEEKAAKPLAASDSDSTREAAAMAAEAAASDKAAKNQVWPLTQFFLFPFCTKSLMICLEGKSMIPP